jgi:hypothetical protein
MSRRSGRKSRVKEGQREARPAPVAHGRGKGLWQAGNRAVSQVIGQMQQDLHSSGKPEIATALAETPIHDDANSARQADALSATAFTMGGEIFLGSSAPPLNSASGKELLRHELTHVVQQMSAQGQIGALIDTPGDAFETAAKTGQPAPAGAPPAIQRDGKMANSAQIIEALTLFLQGLKQKGGGSLVIDATAKAQLQKLVQATAPGSTALDQLLDHPHSSDPATLARKIADMLPKSMDPALLEQLRPLQVEEKKKGVAKLADAFKKTTPSPDPNKKEPTNEEKQKEKGRTHDINEQTFSGPNIEQIPNVVNKMKEKDPPPPKSWHRPKDDSETAKPEDKKPKRPLKPGEIEITEQDILNYELRNSPLLQQLSEGQQKPKDKDPGGKKTAQPETPAPTSVPTQSTQQTGLGVLPSVVVTAIQAAQRSGRAEANLNLGQSLLAQQDAVFGQVRHLLQVHAGNVGTKVTAVHVFFGGKLAKTVRLGGR